MPASMITSKGQTTIPKEIRDYLHLQPGDRVDFIVKEDGKVVLEPATLDLRELEGALHRPGMKAVPESEIKAALKKRFKEKVQ
jgi:antitoxin PrlF